MAERNEKPVGALSNKDEEVKQRLEELKEEYNKLREQKIATDRDMKNLEEQLRVLREKAEKEYGTSDVAELKTILEQRRAENERLVEDYRKHIDGIKGRLEEIEKESRQQRH